jgi:hypothetical protein
VSAGFDDNNDLTRRWVEGSWLHSVTQEGTGGSRGHEREDCLKTQHYIISPGDFYLPVL